MRTARNILLTVVVFLVGVGATQAAKWGDAAAPLHIKEWIKGDAVDVTAGRGKTVYVIEFWATWCGPCRHSIPHLKELQGKFKNKGGVVIGISDEEPDTVKSFVKKLGAKMEYTIAIDDDKKTAADYVEAYGQGGIPAAFI